LVIIITFLLSCDQCSVYCTGTSMIRLLLVDDEPVMLRATKMFLEKDNADIECVTCSSAQEALEKLAASSYDGIVSDYDMTEMDGIALLQEVRRCYGTLPFIIFTGRGREAVVIEAINNGADYYVQKGPDPSSQYADLAHKIRRAVERKRGEDELQETILELQATNEELKVAEEELRQQNEELIAVSEELHAEHQRYVDLFGGAPDSYVVTDEGGVIIEANTAAASMLNVAADFLSGKPLVVFIAEKGKKEFHSRLTRLSSGDEKEVREWELALQPRDSTPTPVLVSVSAIRKTEGTPAHLRWLLRDITERKRAEEALVKSQEEYRTLFESIDEGFCVIEVLFDEADRPVDYRFLVINAAFEMQTGIKNAVGRRMREIAPDHEEHWFQIYGNIARTGEPVRFENPACALGHYYDVYAFRTGDPEQRRVGILFNDIRKRRRAEKALRESEEKYRRFFEQDLTGDIVSAADGRIIDCNPTFLKIFGFNSVEEALNTNILETYPSPEDRQQFLELIKKEGRVYNFSRIRKRRDGSLIHVVENVVGRFDENGELIELLSFMYDDSERKRAEDALKDASKKLNLLTSITRHDILNQITALKAFLVLLDEQHHGNDEATEMFCNLEKIADTIRRQITFTGDYQEMGERKPEWQQVEWVVTRAAESVRLNGASLAVDTGSLEVFADPMLEKVFFNLLDNAVFHGERVEHVRVSFREDGDAGVLVFEDDGVGVPASSKDKIFERGFGKVTGYGLFLVKEILDITGLSIRETGEEGKGARFEIEVPAGKWQVAKN
jgi:PAS domain S-box-containing protein